jgi:hypothetical protein
MHVTTLTLFTIFSDAFKDILMKAILKQVDSKKITILSLSSSYMFKFTPVESEVEYSLLVQGDKYKT